MGAVVFNTPRMFHVFQLVFMSIATAVLVSYRFLTPNLEAISNNNSNNLRYEVAWTPKTKATKCESNSQDLAPFKKSQSKEDDILLKWFNGLCGGSYIEMGGLDGVLFSNSHVFNKALGWTGLLVEASPANYHKLAVNRPNDITINAGVCKEEMDLHWVDMGISAVGGFREFASDEFKKYFWGRKDPKDDQIVRCKPLTQILTAEYGEHAYFDFFSLDIEGAEYQALSSLDFEKFSFGIIFVECDGNNPRKDFGVRAILEENGYHYLGLEQRSCWFANRKLAEIYDHLD